MSLGHRTVAARLLVMVTVLSSGLAAAAVGGAVGVVASPQWSSDGYRNQSLLRRHRVCVENQQYTHLDLCCTNCQAGTFVLNPCERDLELGTCLPCEHGQTYTEHSNGMYACLSCTHCRTDEMETESCSSTTDTRCQCKPGTFCVPDQACEVCKRCARCKVGEEEVRRCTPFSNTLCRKRDLDPTENSPSLPTTPPAPTSPESIVIPVVVLLILILVVGVTSWWFITKHSCEKPCSESQSDNSEIVKIPIDESGGGGTPEERQNSQNAGLEGEESRPESRPLLQETQAGGLSKASPPLVVEDEDRGLGDSLPNTTSSSQTSLSALPTAASSGSSPHHSPSATSLRLQPTDMDDPLQNRLVPLLGSERSLRKSFDLFDEYLDVRIHNKFFRLLGVSDNHIRIAEGGPPGDKVYDLLKSWMQREGLKADINSLLEALLSMDQRRSAESIAYAALQRGYYKHANDNNDNGSGSGGAPCC